MVSVERERDRERERERRVNVTKCVFVKKGQGLKADMNKCKK